MARSKDFGSKKAIQITPPEVNSGTVEYKMSRLMAEEILRGKKVNPQEALCKYVNENMGLKGYCVRVLVDL